MGQPAPHTALPPSVRARLRAQPKAERIYVGAAVDRTPTGYDAYTLTANLDSGEHVKKGRVFRCPVKASKWLAQQSVSL